jgi:hypothetical protein
MTINQTLLLALLEKLCWEQDETHSLDICRLCAGNGMPAGKPEYHTPDCPIRHLIDPE